MTQPDNNFEYRLSTLEKNFGTLANDVRDIKEIVIRLEAKLPKEFPFESQQLTIMQLRKEVDANSAKIESLNTYKWKALGAVAALVILFEVFGTQISDRIFPHSAPQNQSSQYLIK